MISIFTIGYYRGVKGVITMSEINKIWNQIDNKQIKTENKYRLAFFIFSVISAVFGALVWLIIGQRILPGLDNAACFIGLPAVVSWLFVYIYSCNHSFK